MDSPRAGQATDGITTDLKVPGRGIGFLKKGTPAK